CPSVVTAADPPADALSKEREECDYYPSTSWPDAQQDVLRDTEGSTSTPHTLEGDLESDCDGDVSWCNEKVLQDKVQQQNAELTRLRREIAVLRSHGANPPDVQELLQRAKLFVQAKDSAKDLQEPKDLQDKVQQQNAELTRLRREIAVLRSHGANPPDVQELLQRAKLFVQAKVKDVPKHLLPHFATLGLDPNATADAVRKRYRWMAIQCHPDKCSRKDATKQFQDLVVAYEAVAKHLA
ncbi:JJJ1, partial [Symbiodinium natans]